MMNRLFRTAALSLALSSVQLTAWPATPQLCSGRYFSMALRSDGQVLAWGSDAKGQLGQGRLLFRVAPGPIGNLANVRAVSSRNSGTALALTSDGRVFAWGDNEYGEVGDGTRTYYGNTIIAAHVSNIVAVASGGLHSIALAQDGTVWAWGDNSRGQLGDGSNAFRAEPRPVPGLASVVSISAGAGYSLALKSDGTVWGWGANRNGQLGSGRTDDALRPQQATNLGSVTAISAGQFTTLALRSDGTVWAWGSNSQGQVGDGSTTDRATPVQVAGLSGVRAISAGDFHGAALRNDGTVWIWGINQQGQLGNAGFDAVIHTATQVPGLAGVTAISAGAEYTLALKGNGSVMGWGRNTYGVLGVDNAQFPFVNVPTQVPGISGATEINAGFDVSFAVTGGTVMGWGKNNYQQLASGPSQPNSQTTPSLVTGLGGVEAITCARYSGYALKADGSLWSWGGNDWGVLGDGTLVPRSTPVRITGLPPLTTVSGSSSSYSADDANAAHVMAVDRSGTVWTWGNNFSGQLGNGILTFSNGNIYYATSPISLGTSLPTITAVSAGGYHSLALDTQGRIWSWGDNASGELGDGSTTQRTTPVVVSSLSGVARISAGWGFSLALTSDRRAWSWGDHSGGQLGTGATADQLVPAPISALSEVRSISAGAEHSLAVLGDGSLWAWGFNTYGAIGDGTYDERDFPVRVVAAGTVSSAVAGNQFSLAALPGGAALAWGNNGNGLLGDGTFAERTGPQLVLGVKGEGFLNLSPQSQLQVPADRIPAFRVVASGGASTAAANVTANIQYRPQDVGSSGSVYVFALAPASVVKNAIVGKDAIVVAGRRRDGAKSTPAPCVLAQLTASGQLVGVTTSNLQAYLGGVLSSQDQAVTILNGVSTAQIGGATFFVGYGSNTSSMFTNGTNRAVVSVPGSVSCQPQVPKTGWWWNPAEGGRGYSLEVRGNNIFFASYLYDISGRATWYAASGPTSLDGSTFNGRLLSFANGQALEGAYRAPEGAVDNGPLTLAFNDSTHGVLSWAGGTIPIERFNIVANGISAPVQASQPESGWWWNAQEGGRGYFIEWQGGSAFLAGYMYDGAGKPVWYASLNPTLDAHLFQGTWAQYANGQTLAGAYKPATLANGNVAPVKITFQGLDVALITLGTRQVPLTRFRF